jgi:hypothetical protein
LRYKKLALFNGFSKTPKGGCGLSEIKIKANLPKAGTLAELGNYR